MDAFLTSFGAFQKRDMNALPGVQEKIEETGNVNQNILSYLIRLSAKSKLSEEAEVGDPQHGGRRHAYCRDRR